MKYLVILLLVSIGYSQPVSTPGRSGPLTGDASALTNISHLVVFSIINGAIQSGVSSFVPFGGPSLNNVAPSDSRSTGILFRSGIITNLILSLGGVAITGTGTNMFFGFYTNGICSNVTNTLLNDNAFTFVATNTGTASFYYPGGTNVISMCFSNQTGAALQAGASKNISGSFEILY